MTEGLIFNPSVIFCGQRFFTDCLPIRVGMNDGTPAAFAINRLAF